MSDPARGKYAIEITEGGVRIRDADKVMSVTRRHDAPGAEIEADYIIDLDDIVHWDAPNEEIEIEVDELQAILQAIETAFERRGLTIAFE